MKVKIINMSYFKGHSNKPELTTAQVTELYHAYVNGERLDATLDITNGVVSVYLDNVPVAIPACFVDVPFTVTPDKFDRDFISSGCIINAGKSVHIVMSSDRTEQGIENTIKWASPGCKIVNEISNHVRAESGNWYRIELNFYTGMIYLLPTVIRY